MRVSDCFVMSSSVAVSKILPYLCLPIPHFPLGFPLHYSQGIWSIKKRTDELFLSVNLFQVKLGKNICSKERVSDLLILGPTELIQMKSPFPFASHWLRHEYKSQPWTNETGHKVCWGKDFALWLKEKQHGVLLFISTLYEDVMSGAAAAILRQWSSKTKDMRRTDDQRTGRSWVFEDIILQTNWLQGSSASDSC